MKNLEKYRTDTLISEKELEDITKRLVEAKFGANQRASWKEKLAQDYQVQQTPKVAKRSNLYVIAAIAASLLLLLMAYPLSHSLSSDSQQLAMEYLEAEAFPNKLTRKDVHISTPEVRLRATEAYNQGDYETARQYYKELILLADTQVDDYLYLGLSESYLHHFESAVKHLEGAKQLSSEREGKFMQEINWFLSLAYIQTSQYNKANTLLEEIVAQQAWKHEAAKELLENM